MSALPDVQEESRIIGAPLPERKIGRGISHLPYGVFHLTALYCGFPAPPAEFVGEWQHGWNPSDTVVHPEMITASDGLSMHRRTTHTFLVAREDEQRYLREHGYRSAHAVGLPIVYQSRQPVERLPGSLLVMPVHSLEYTNHAWNFDQYADEIDAIRGRFSSVVACVSSSCFRRGYWVDAFKRRGIPLISGSDIFDANAYPRLASLFGRFDFMTTNGFGSHLAYSALFGAKPSIYGTIATFRRKDFEDDAYYQNNPELLRLFLDLYTPEALRRRFPHLFVLPWEAPDQYEWAAFETGVRCKKSPEELARLLGWDQSRSSSDFLKVSASRIARKSSELATRIKDPGAHARKVSLSALKRAVPGQIARVAAAPWSGLESMDGPRFAWELETYYYGEAANVIVNPSDGPALDLAPREGVTVLALAQHHPDRTIYYLTGSADDDGRLRQNLAASNIAADRLVPLQRSFPFAPDPDTLYERDNWNSLRVSFGGIFSEIVVLRVAVAAKFWQAAVASVEDFAHCRLLLVECHDDPQNYLGPMLSKLADLGFVPNLDRLTSSSFRQPGLLSQRTVLSMALTRSGLDLPEISAG